MEAAGLDNLIDRLKDADQDTDHESQNKSVMKVRGFGALANRTKKLRSEYEMAKTHKDFERIHRHQGQPPSSMNDSSDRETYDKFGKRDNSTPDVAKDLSDLGKRLSLINNPSRRGQQMNVTSRERQIFRVETKAPNKSPPAVIQ